jgi:glycosyltransferase involved in cell wall biosynthesis
MSASPARVAVMLPYPYRGGTLKAARNVARMICRGSEEADDSVKVVFGIVEGAYDKDEFHDLRNMGIGLRDTRWIQISRAEMENYQRFSRYEVPLRYERYYLPSDGASNFEDCDLWLIVSDRTFFPVAPLRPYGVLIHDYIQRYVPETIGMGDEVNDFWSETFGKGFLGTVRQANFVLNTTPRTRQDTINYAGVSPEKVVMAPLDFELPRVPRQHIDFGKDYLLWETGTAYHENHLNALKALEMYYEEHEGRLRTCILGFNTRLFDPKLGSTGLTGANEAELHILRIRERIMSSSVLREKVRALGLVSSRQYTARVAQARFLFHPNRTDNGSFTVVEAAYLGTPVLSHDYEQIRFMDERFGLNLSFCNAGDPRDAAARLKEMEVHYEQRRAQLPAREHMEAFSWERVAPEFWKVVREAAS